MRRFYGLLTVTAIVAMLLVAAPASAAPAATAGGSGCGQFYTIHRGDNLYRIALRFGTSVWALQNLNGIWNPDRIYAGQTICVLAGGGHDGGHHGGSWYTVRCGDTLANIAHRFGVNVWHLARVNHIYNIDRIYAGQALWIP